MHTELDCPMTKDQISKAHGKAKEELLQEMKTIAPGMENWKQPFSHGSDLYNLAVKNWLKNEIVTNNLYKTWVQSSNQKELLRSVEYMVQPGCYFKQ